MVHALYVMVLTFMDEMLMFTMGEDSEGFNKPPIKWR